jgi:hypothetical protein
MIYMKKYPLMICCIYFLLMGCAGVKIYSDASLQHPTAVQFHYAKPFLLVERNATKDGTTKTTIVYLPDQSETYYAKMVSGLGNSDLKIAFENGSIASLGTSSDNKILLSTGSLSSLISDLAKMPNASSNELKIDANEPSFDLYEIMISDGKTSLKKVAWKK